MNRPSEATKTARLPLIIERAEVLAERALGRRVRAHRNSGRGLPPGILAEEHAPSRSGDWIDLVSESTACSVREVGP